MFLGYWVYESDLIKLLMMLKVVFR